MSGFSIAPSLTDGVLLILRYSYHAYSYNQCINQQMPWRNTQEYHSCHELSLMNCIVSCFIECFCWLISLICGKSVTTQNLWFFQENLLKVLKCYNFLWVQRRHNCSPATGFTNCVMTLYLLKVHLQTFLSIPITQKCQILSCDTLVANERYIVFLPSAATV